MDQQINPDNGVDPAVNQVPPADPPAFPGQPPLPDVPAGQVPPPADPPPYEAEEENEEREDVPAADHNRYGEADTLGGVLDTVEVCEQSKQWGMFAHLSGVISGFIGPLIIWQIKKDELPLAGEQAKEALNFQITMAILTVVAIITCAIFIGFILTPAVMLFNVIFSVIAGLKANNEEHFSYPIIFRFIS